MITVQTQQVLVPKQVYIGDRAELRCTFSTTAKIKAEGFCGELDYNQYDIKDVKLQPSGVNTYTLTIAFVPWRTGDIIIPDYRLSEEAGTAGTETEADEMIIHFNPVNIVSLTQKDSITTLRDSASPLLLPGTIYKLYGSLIAAILVLIVGIRLIVKHKDVAFFITRLVSSAKNNSNRRRTIKQLGKIAKNTQLSDNESAAEIQKTLRTYLEKRFDYPFSKTVSSELSAAFTKLTGGLLSEEKQDAYDDVVIAFVRTDYIRYSSASKFGDDEKPALVKKLINDIETIENTKSEKSISAEKDTVTEKSNAKEDSENA
jgi:hypothetical protein